MANSIAKESLRGTVVHYIGIGIGLLTTFFLLPLFFSPEQIGLTRMLVEVATLLSGLGTLGLSVTISRFFPYFREETAAGQKSNHRGFLYYIGMTSLIGLLITLPLSYLFREDIIRLFAKNSPLFVEHFFSVFPLTVFIAFWTITELYSIQLMRLSVPKGIREVLLRVLLLMSYILYALSWVSFGVFIGIFVLSYGLCMLASLAYVGRISSLSLRHSPDFPSPSIRKSFLRYTLLYTLTTVGTTLAGRMDLFVLSVKDSQGLTSVGVFSIAFFMVAIVETPTRAIISLATPKIALAMKEGDLGLVSKLYKQVSCYQLLSGIIIFALIWVNLDNIFGIMPHGDQFAGGKYIFLFLGIGKLVEVACTASHPIVSCSRYYYWNLYYTAIIILMAITANLYLVPLWGGVGAGMATLITTVVSYGFQVTMLGLRMRLWPFSLPMLKALLLGGILLALDWLCPTIGSAWVDLFVRSALLGLVAIAGVWSLRLVPELMELIRPRQPKH